MPIILGLDTCTEACSVALDLDGTIFSVWEKVSREHSQRILPMVDSILVQAQIKLEDLTCIAYGRGPGSFTGIRICTSITQGLALGSNKPVIGISTLATMAQAAVSAGNQRVLVAIDARMGEVYWAEFVAQNGLATLIGSEQISTPDLVTVSSNDNIEILACGTGFETYPELFKISHQFTQFTPFTLLPNAEDMLPFARQALINNEVTNVDLLEPIYLRDSVAWKKLPGRV